MPGDSIGEFVTSFLDSSVQRAGHIRAALARGDLAAAAREAHAICGAAGNVGASRLDKAARHLQAACSAGDSPAALSAARELDLATRPDDRRVAGWIASLPANPVPATLADGIDPLARVAS